MIRELLSIVRARDVYELIQTISSSDLDTILELCSKSDTALHRLREAVELFLGPSFSEESIPSPKIRDEIYRAGVLSAMILAVVLGPRHIKTFAVRSSKLIESFLSNVGDEELQRFGRILRIDLRVGTPCVLEIPQYIDARGELIKTCYRYAVKLHHYLVAARTLFTEPSWKLSNQTIDRGWVYIERRERISRLLAERFRQLIEEKLMEIHRYDDARTLFQNIVEERSVLKQILSEVASSRPSLPPRAEGRGEHGVRATAPQVPQIDLSTLGSVDELLSIANAHFPPCIQKILSDLLNGENLSHHQRFALATFLINIGVDLDLILELFRRAPDFNEKIARYQIEHLAGLRGSRKKYLPYSCATMKTLGMCPGSECGVKNPLVAFYRSIKRSRSSKSGGSRSKKKRSRDETAVS